MLAARPAIVLELSRVPCHQPQETSDDLSPFTGVAPYEVGVEHLRELPWPKASVAVEAHGSRRGGGDQRLGRIASDDVAPVLGNRKENAQVRGHKLLRKLTRGIAMAGREGQPREEDRLDADGRAGKVLIGHLAFTDELLKGERE